MAYGRYTLVLATLTAIVTFVTWPQVLHLTTGLNDLGDPLLNAWTLAWVAHATVTDPARLFDANIFHPETGALAYSEPLLVPALLVAPLHWLGADPILAHNLLLLMGYVGGGLAVFVLTRSLTGSDAAAFVSAVAFAALPLRAEYYAKVQLQLAMWIPLALWRLHALIRTGRPRNGLWTGTFIALQFYTCVYYAIYGALFVGMVAGVACWRVVPGKRAGVARGVAAGAVVVAVACLPLGLMLRSASAVVGERSLDEVQAGSARLDDYARAHPESWLHGDPARPGVGERRLFPGYAVPALALVGLAGGGVVPIAYGAAAAGSVALSLGTNGPVYSWLYEHLTAARALRVPARFAMFASLGAAVLAGFGVARLTRRTGRPGTAVLATLAVAAVVAEGKTRPLDLSRLPEPAPLVYRWLAQQPPAVVCEYPLGNLEGRAGPQDATYEYYSALHWHTLVNGYSGFEPPAYRDTRAALASFPDRAAIDRLVEIGTEYLLVHGRFYIAGDVEADVEALKVDPRLTWVGRFAWRDGHASDVFRVRR